MGVDLGKIVQYRKQLIIVAAAFAFVAIAIFTYVKNQRPELTGPGYADVFSDEEEFAAQEKIREEHAAMAEVDAQGHPTERAKLKVLESLRAQ